MVSLLHVRLCLFRSPLKVRLPPLLYLFAHLRWVLLLAQLLLP